MPALFRYTPILALVVAGCASTLAQQEVKRPAGTTREIYVAAQKVPCMGVGPMECLQIRERPDQPWQLFYDTIQGFEFHPGTEYRLRVIEEPIPDPPMDGSSIRTTLDRVLEQHADGASVSQ